MLREIILSSEKIEAYLRKEGLLREKETLNKAVKITVYENDDPGKNYIIYTDMSVGLFNLLCKLKLTTLEEIIEFSAEDLRKFRYMGEKKIEEIKNILLSKGMYLKNQKPLD